MKVFLYSTVGCHLCEQAKAILWPLLQHYQYCLSEIDIAASDKLIERYGIKIPVLAVENYDAELNWPFTVQEADVFLQNIKRFK